jgi:hypothetical protein
VSCRSSAGSRSGLSLAVTAGKPVENDLECTGADPLVEADVGDGTGDADEERIDLVEADVRADRSGVLGRPEQDANGLAQVLRALGRFAVDIAADVGERLDDGELACGISASSGPAGTSKPRSDWR